MWVTEGGAIRVEGTTWAKALRQDLVSLQNSEGARAAGKEESVGPEASGRAWGAPSQGATRPDLRPDRVTACVVKSLAKRIEGRWT